MDLKQKSKTGNKSLAETQDLFASYDKDGNYIEKTLPASAPIKDSGKSKRETTPSPISETQNLAVQCVAEGAQSLQVQDKTQKTSSSPCSSNGDSDSSYSLLSQKSAPELDKGRELVVESLRERPIPLLLSKSNKKIFLYGKESATINQIRMAIRRNEVSIPSGQSKKVSALLDNAAEYESLKSERFEIKWSRASSQWQQ